MLGLASCGDPDPPKDPARSAAPEPVQAVMRESTVATFSRSPLASSHDNEPAQPASPLPENDPAADAGIAALMHKAVPQLSKVDALALIDQARAHTSAKLCDFVIQLLRHPDVDVRSAALTLVEGHDAPAMLMVVKAALADKEVAVRLQGVEVLKHLRGEAAHPVFLAALQDADSNVRMSAFTSALDVDEVLRGKAITTGIAAPHEDVASSALSFMEAELMKTHVPSLLQALDHPSASVRRQAYERLFLTLDEKFTTSAQARAWWQKNQHRFDDDLVMIQAPAVTAPSR